MPKKTNVVSLCHIKPVEEDDLNQIKEAIRLEEAQTPLVEELVIVKPKRKPPAKKVIEVIEPLCEEQLPKGVLGSSNEQLPKEDTKKILLISGESLTDPFYMEKFYNKKIKLNKDRKSVV